MVVSSRAGGGIAQGCAIDASPSARVTSPLGWSRCAVSRALSREGTDAHHDFRRECEPPVWSSPMLVARHAAATRSPSVSVAADARYWARLSGWTIATGSLKTIR